jgi:4-hydroxy-L-threonine phosphate dehydrogenase PdxA
MSEKKVIVVVCGDDGGIGKSIREVIAAKKLDDNDVQIVNLAQVEKSELKELADQLNSLSERENRVMQDLCTLGEPEKLQDYFIPSPKHSPKGHQRKYKFHK